MVVLHQADNKRVIALAVLSVAVYAGCAAFVTGPDRTLWFLGAYAVTWALYLTLHLHDRHREAIGPVWLLVAWALVARVVLACGEVWLSDDLWRYLLDGRVFAEGVNPFRYAPADPWVQENFAGLVRRVNHPEVPTIYPPAVQVTGLLVAWAGWMETGWRLLMALVDTGVMWAVATLFGGGARGWRAAAVYGLCPLAIFESGANGHLEGLAALPLVLGAAAMLKRHPWRAGSGFAIAALVKYYPLLLLPLFARREGSRRMMVTTVALVAVALIPFMLHGVDMFAGLKTYLAHWSFNSPLYALLRVVPLPDAWVRLVPFLVGGTVAAVAGWRREEPLAVIPMVLFAFLVVGPTLHPWYALWILPWLGPRPHPGLWAFVGAMGLAYAVWWSVSAHGVWELPRGVPELMWGIVALGWMLSFWRDAGEAPAETA